MSATLACNSEWLNIEPVTQTISTTGDFNNWNCYPSYGYYYYPVYTSSPARPIKLTLSEVEKLRKAARADDKLKAILQKFTSQIEITVDFD